MTNTDTYSPQLTDPNSFYRWFMKRIAQSIPKPQTLDSKPRGIAQNLVRHPRYRMKFDPRTVREVEETRDYKNNKPPSYKGPYKAVQKDLDGAYRRSHRLDGKF